MKDLWPKKLFLMLLTALFLCVGTSAGAATYSHIVAFGDSLSDGSDGGGLAQYNTNPDFLACVPTGAPDSWTNNGSAPYNGDVWLDALAANWGATLENYAIGGAMTSGHEDACVMGIPLELGYDAQVAGYVAGGPSISPDDTLFVIWIGGNDCLELIKGEHWYSSNPAVMIPWAVTNIANGMSALYGAGARHFLVCNMPDFGVTRPFFGNAGATGLAVNFNAALAAALDNFETATSGTATVYRYDAFTALSDIIDAGIFANPSPDTWLTMVDPPGGPDQCEWSYPNVSGLPDDFVFFDCIHPTAAVHGLIADQVLNNLWIRSDDKNSGDLIEDSTYPQDMVTANGTVDGPAAHEKPAGKDSAIAFDGVDDYLSLADSDDWDLGGGDFTIDLWVNLDAAPGQNDGIFSTQIEGTSEGYRMQITNGKFAWSSRGATAIFLDSGFTPTLNQWHHVAAVRSGDLLTLYVDGVARANRLVTGINFNTQGGGLVIGRVVSSKDTNYFSGYMDEFRIAKGNARWTADFSGALPNIPYLDPTGVIAYIDVDGDGIYNNGDTGFTTTIQDAIDAAASGQTVRVFAGAYTEQLTVTDSLNLIGAGAGTTTILAPTSGRATLTEGAVPWDYVIAADGNGTPIDVRIEGFTIDANGQDATMAQNFAGVFLRDVGDGTDDGLCDCAVTNFGAFYGGWSGALNTWMGNTGVTVYGNSDLTVSGNQIDGYTISGINAVGADVRLTATGNDLDGSASSYVGIFLRSGAGMISGNTIYDHAHTANGMGIYIYEAAAAYIDGSTSPNTLTSNSFGVWVKGTDLVLIDGNTFTDNIYKSVLLADDADDAVIRSNTITMSDGDANLAGIDVGGNCGRAQIGGPASEDGNIITLPSAGAATLYAIWLEGTDTDDIIIRNNTITGGMRSIQFDGAPGHSGDNYITDNTISNPGFGAIMSSCTGNFVITGNIITNGVRPMEFWQSGAGVLLITGNTIDGTNFEAINIGSAGSVSGVNENAFLNINDPGPAMLANRTALAIDATNNWWGDIDPSNNVVNSGGGSIDYDPWYISADMARLSNENIENLDRGTFFATIQGAIDDAGTVDGDTIQVPEGTYPENLTVDKRLSILGAGSALSIIDVVDGIAVEITADDVRVDGFGITHGIFANGQEDVGIRLNQSDGSTIQNNKFTANALGLVLLDAGSNDIFDNEFQDNAYGIWLEGTTDGLGHFDGGDNGPFYSLSLYNNIDGNSIASCFAGDGIYLDAACENNIFNDNTITGCAGNGYYAWKASNNTLTDNTISNNAYGIQLFGSSGNTVTGNTVETNTNIGIWLRCGALSTTSNTITDNGVTGGGMGFYLQDDYSTNNYVGVITGNTIRNNDISGNTTYGMAVFSVEPGTLIIATNNWWGDATGPYHGLTNTLGLGNAVSDYVDYDPWMVEEGVYLSLWVRSDDKLIGEPIEDAMGHEVFAEGGIAHEEDVGKDSAIAFDGVNDYLSLADSDDWDLGADDFTIDFWVNLDAPPGQNDGLFSTQIEGTSEGYRMQLTDGKFAWYSRGGATILLDSGFAPGLNQWYHVAAVRSGDTLTIYVDGVARTSRNVAGITFNTEGGGLVIGRIVSSKDTNYFSGYMDEFRITKGTARTFNPNALPNDPSAETVSFTLLQTSDLHHHASGYGPYLDYDAGNAANVTGGYARLATLINDVKDEGGDTLLIDSGDFLMGTPYDLATGNDVSLAFFKQMEYDAITLGNHEFDWTPDGLAMVLSNSIYGIIGFDVPIIASNMTFDPIDTGDDNLELLYGVAPPAPIIPSHIITLPSGLKVGLLGLLGPGAQRDAPLSPPLTFNVGPDAGGNYRWDDAGDWSAIQDKVDALDPDVDIIVVMSHSGVNGDLTSGDDIDLANNVTGIDIIASGHTHVATHDVIQVGDTYIFSPGEYGEWLSRMDITYNLSAGTIDAVDFNLLEVDASVDKDLTIDGLIKANWDGGLNAALNGLGYGSLGAPVSKTAFDLTQSDLTPYGISNLGSLCADAVRYTASEYGASDCQIAVVAKGVIRDDILVTQSDPGVIPFSDVYTALPLGISPLPNAGDPAGPPYNSGMPGYPLWEMDLRPFEVLLLAELGMTGSQQPGYGSFYLNFSGLQIEYDADGALGFEGVKVIKVYDPDDIFCEGAAFGNYPDPVVLVPDPADFTTKIHCAVDIYALELIDVANGLLNVKLGGTPPWGGDWIDPQNPTPVLDGTSDIPEWKALWNFLTDQFPYGSSTIDPDVYGPAGSLRDRIIPYVAPVVENLWVRSDNVTLPGDAAVFADSSASAHAVTGNGGIVHDAFGADTCISFDGVDDYLHVADDDDWDFDSGDFTIDFWVNLDAAPGQNDGLFSTQTVGTATGYRMQITDGKFAWFMRGDLSLTLDTGVAPALNEWYHLAAVRSGNMFTLYVDGVPRASLNVAGKNFNTAGGGLVIGRVVSSVDTNYFSGHMDEFRVFKGNAVVPDPNDLPNKPFPDLSVYAACIENAPANGAYDVGEVLFTTVAGAIGAAVDGNTILVFDGTHEEGGQLTIGAKSLTIVGLGSPVLQRTAGGSYFLSASGAATLTIENLTIDAGADTTTTNFVAHLAGVGTLTLTDFTLVGQGKDYTTDGNPYDPLTMLVVGGLDINDVTTAILTRVAVSEAGRNGLSFTDTDAISLTDVSVENCGHSDSTGWAGLAIYGTTTSLTLAGTNSIDNVPIGVNAEANVLPATGNLAISSAVLPLGALDTTESDTFAEDVANVPFKVVSAAAPGGAGYYATESDAVTGALLGKTVYGIDSAIFSLVDDEFVVDPALTIQAAVDAALLGDTVNVRAGAYSGSITIDRALTLLGPNAGLNPTEDPSPRGAEAVITGDAATAVTIDADGITIDGFTITNPSGKHGIYDADYGTLSIVNNIVTDVGSSDATLTGTNFGVGIVPLTEAIDTVTINNNLITFIAGGYISGAEGKSGIGIAVGWSTEDYDVTNLDIQGNTITDITSEYEEAYPMGKGAIGIQLNLGASSSGYGRVVNADILGNVIHSLHGLWATGIGLEGDTPGTNVQLNVISGLTDGKEDFDPLTHDDLDASAVKVEDNDGAVSVVITNNQFSTCEVGVRNVTGILIDAEWNWWGSDDGPSSGGGGGGTGTGVGVWTDVDFEPWTGIQGTSNLWIRSDEETDGAVAFDDFSTNHAVDNPNGTVMHENPFGADSAAAFNGTDAYLSVADDDDWDFGTGDFTIDFWVNLDAVPGQNDGLFSTQSVGTATGYRMQLTDGKFAWYMRGDLSLLLDTGFTPTLNQWHHVAAIRFGDTLKLYVDGVARATRNVAGVNFNTAGGGLVIGRVVSGVDTNYFSGHMDEFRVTKGKARWEADFTPPNDPS